LATHPALSGTLQRDAVAFAAWYAAAGGALEWPEEVERIRRRARSRKLSLERMMKLLAKINYTLSGHTSAEHARLVLEGYAVHDWVAGHGAAFMDLARALYDRVNSPDGQWPDGASPFSVRLHELGRALQLAPLEQDILAFAFLTTASTELSGIFRQLAADGRRAQFACVAPFWVDLVARADSLEEALLEPVEEKLGSGHLARLAAEDLEIATRILRTGSEPGVNLLLYGPPDLEGDLLLKDLVTASGRSAWRVRRFEDAPRGVLPSLAFVSFQVLAGRSDRSLLVIERPSE